MDSITVKLSSPLGDITLASDGRFLTGLWFDGQKHYGSTLGEYREGEVPVFEAVRNWLNIYFKGEIPDFTPPILLIGTPFQKAVWEQLLLIPYGSTRTYRDIAKAVSCSSCQAVGGAVARNPISLIVPCHRIIGSDGNLTGYAAGLDKKLFLLQLERRAAL